MLKRINVKTTWANIPYTYVRNSRVITRVVLDCPRYYYQCVLAVMSANASRRHERRVVTMRHVRILSNKTYRGKKRSFSISSSRHFRSAFTTRLSGRLSRIVSSGQRFFFLYFFIFFLLAPGSAKESKATSMTVGCEHSTPITTFSTGKKSDRIEMFSYLIFRISHTRVSHFLNRHSYIRPEN